MPSFCRHNRLIQNCPICSREQEVELRPLVSSSAPRTAERAPRPASGAGSRGGGTRSPRAGGAGGVTVTRAANSVDDGYRSPLVPGLRSTADASRLVQELAFAVARLDQLRHAPPGLYGEVADPTGDLEERTWLAFLIAYLGPLEAAEDPFAAITEVRTSWRSGEAPDLDEVSTGPRSAHDPKRGQATIAGYQAWAGRAGSQQGAFTGEVGWSAERRFARIFERLSLPGLHRAARFELLVDLGHLGLYELQASALALGGSDEVTVAAKRAFGIGDSLLLERRGAELARECGVPLAALDLALYNWAAGERITVGVAVEPSTDVLQTAAGTLGVDAV